MANLSQLQMPSIDTGQLSGKDGKKIKSYLFQIQEMLRYALNDIDEDNLSEELRSKIESGGLSSEISQALDAITLRVTGLDDAQAELKLTAEGLTSQVEAQGGRISTLEQTATSITARVETAEGDITTLEQTATSLTGRIESAEGDINTLTATATGLEGRIESAEGSITTLTATADGLSTRVESAEGNITSLTQTAEGFGTRIETAEGDISSLQQTASGLTSRIETAEGDVTELQQTAGSLTGRIESAEGDITTLTATANGLSTRVESAEGNITSLTQTADSLKTRVESAEGDITTLTATAEGLKTRVTDAEGNITTLTATANGLTTRVESAEGDVTTIKQWADSLTLSVANGDSSSTIRLMAGSTEISSGSIGFTGVVTFSDLSTWNQDKTIINGGNITTGQIHNSGYSTVYDLDNAWIRMGASDGNRVYIDKSGIQWYGGTATSSGMSQGVIQNGLKTTTEGDTTIFCADTRYQKYGWWHDSSFQGITIEQVDNSVGCSGKLEVNQGIQCRSLSAWDAKNRIVRTDFGNLAINAVESPEPMFCDAGSGECDETGLCYIATEPRYRETVSETQDLRWALTPTGASAALWAEKTAFGAIVHGPAGQCFDWVCWGVQRGFEGVYADVSDAKYPEEENRGAALLDAAETEAAVSLPLTIEEAS
jgi:predicted  nucleic acid-binding Zn-ribbon protein|nr:MAG TPA: Tail needle protein [Caudoviricetes sp.]